MDKSIEYNTCKVCGCWLEPWELCAGICYNCVMDGEEYYLDGF
jgi:hypothetical protein